MSDDREFVENNEDTSMYPTELVEKARNPKYFGRLNDPTSSAFVKGPCGDEMEFYLVITDNIIEDVRYYTKGCLSTLICGSATAELAMGKSIYDALDISPKKVIDTLHGLPDEGCHCTILAVSTLYKAIADYLLKP
ncbi:iron-sulfur cluster assembly scaffold protein [Candidatus Omnitrophota bacterium]